jgi:DNA-directed RNA polymerase subunit beta'
MSHAIDYIQIQLTSPKELARWSKRVLPNNKVVGEIKKGDTINYRSFKPELGGLFCERIFGSTIHNECSCGRTRRRKPVPDQAGTAVAAAATAVTLSPVDGVMPPSPVEGGMTPSLQADAVGYMCPGCGVEPTNAKVRRYRMGCIRLRKPVAHLWYFRNTPNMISVLLNMAAAQVDQVVHFISYTPSVPNVLNYASHEGQEWYVDEWEAVHAFFTSELPRFFIPFDNLPWAKRSGPNKGMLDSLSIEMASTLDEEEEEYVPPEDTKALWDRGAKGRDYRGFPLEPYYIENCGADAIYRLMQQLDLPFLELMLTQRVRKKVALYHTVRAEKALFGIFKKIDDMGAWAQISMDSKGRVSGGDDDDETDYNAYYGLTRQGQRNRGLNIAIKKVAQRLHYVRLLARKHTRPEWMLVDVFPVLPPDLRPMIQLSNGRFASSDLNDIYRRLIYRKLRTDRFDDVFDAACAPDFLIRQDLCLMQEAADAIIDNGRLEKPMQSANKNVLKSLTAVIEGKHGRFRQNLLGKRVDYSGRSVIVVGPKLRLHQCGLPREMALELFHPFVIQALLEQSVAQNIRAAKNMIQKRPQKVWDILERVVYAHPLLLNRAPTLHRLGIQAFEPILLSGRAIQLHPLVCPAFNADFDGDQMAVHIPLSLEAQAEARLLMLATHNWLSPATGEPTIVPSQDMILGFYYLTTRRPLPALSKTLEAGAHGDRVVPGKAPFKVFQTFARVLQRYALGGLKLHELVWVQSGTPADVHQAMPVEVRVNQSGHETLIYDAVAVESWPRPLQRSVLSKPLVMPLAARMHVLGYLPPRSGRVPQLHQTKHHTFYLRTTPGRLILNSLIYENLFL